jgi:hypothetical protein
MLKDCSADVKNAWSCSFAFVMHLETRHTGKSKVKEQTYVQTYREKGRNKKQGS